MSGGGPSSAQSSTQTGPPGWLGSLYQQYLGSVGQQVFGGSGTPGGSPLSMPSGLNQQVAPFTPQQNQALSNYSSITPQAQNLTGLGAGTVASFASGAQNNPATNPNLNAYYNQAATQLTNQYQNATEPGIMAQGAQTGSVGGTGEQTATQQAQYGLAQGLGTLGANIFEPAFQQGQQLQYSAGTQLPTSAMSLYGPSSALYSAGATQQGQQQNVNNTAYQNALTQQQYPFALLSEYSGALGQGLGAYGSTNAQQPVLGSGGQKL